MDATSRMTWRAWFDVPADKALARLADWEKGRPFVDDAKAYSVEKSTADGALLRVKKKAPLIFMPDPDVLFRATVKSEPGGGGTVTWTQVDGPARSMVRTWKVVPKAGGAWIEHETVLELPFSPPSFLFGDGAELLARQVAVARRELGAKVSRAKAATKPVMGRPEKPTSPAKP